MSSIVNSMSDRNYEIIAIAERFHKLKHLDFKLQEIKNSTFDYENQEYINSLIVFLSLPILALTIVLLIYLIYSICICICGNSKDRKRGIRIQSKVFIFLFGLVCCLSFIVGLYGSWKIHKGFDSVRNSTEDAINLLNSVKNETQIIGQNLDISNDVKVINNELDVFASLADVSGLKQLMESVNSYSLDSKKKVNEAYNELSSTDLDQVPQQMKQYEEILWIASLSILCALAVLAFVFTFGVYSRCLLTVFTILGVFSLIISSGLVSISLTLTVGISDFCYEAKPFIKSELSKSIDPNIAYYYVNCPQNGDNKIGQLIDESKTYLNNAKNSLTEFNNMLNSFCDDLSNIPSLQCPRDSIDKINTSDQNIKTQIDILLETLRNLGDLVDCHRINNDLNQSLTSVCTDVVEGMVMIFFNVITASFCFAILVFSATFAIR